MKLTTKRFVIRKTLIGKNAIINFTNKKNETYTYETCLFISSTNLH